MDTNSELKNRLTVEEAEKTSSCATGDFIARWLARNVSEEEDE
jgi:hypothetical protein